MEGLQGWGHPGVPLSSRARPCRACHLCHRPPPPTRLPPGPWQDYLSTYLFEFSGSSLKLE